MLALELRKLSMLSLRLKVTEGLRSGGRVDLGKPMTMSTATALELIAKPMVFDTKLRLENHVEESREALMEVLGSDVWTAP